ncbi:hypothetical protein ACPCG0_00285 [Propionibacteriaceae bacterium Y1923]
MTQQMLTLGPATESGWSAVTDRGERVEVPRAVAGDLRPVTGQRVVAELDEQGSITRITIGGTGVGLPLHQP